MAKDFVRHVPKVRETPLRVPRNRYRIAEERVLARLRKGETVTITNAWWSLMEPYPHRWTTLRGKVTKEALTREDFLALRRLGKNGSVIELSVIKTDDGVWIRLAVGFPREARAKCPNV